MRNCRLSGGRPVVLRVVFSAGAVKYPTSVLIWHTVVARRSCFIWDFCNADYFCDAFCRRSSFCGRRAEKLIKWTKSTPRSDVALTKNFAETLLRNIKAKKNKA
jgi:hypothetical protein